MHTRQGQLGMEQHKQAAPNGLWNREITRGTARGSPKKRRHCNKTATDPVLTLALPSGN